MNAHISLAGFIEIYATGRKNTESSGGRCYDDNNDIKLKEQKSKKKVVPSKLKRWVYPRFSIRNHGFSRH